MEWQNSGGSTKLDAEVNRLVWDVLLSPNFNAQDLKGFEAGQENHWIDATDKQSFLDIFQETSIDIEVPSGSKDIRYSLFQVSIITKLHPLSVLLFLLHLPQNSTFLHSNSFIGTQKQIKKSTFSVKCMTAMHIMKYMTRYNVR